MHEMFASALAAERRRTLVEDAVVARARAARRPRFGRRARSGASASRPVVRRYPVRATFRGWLAAGQL